MLFTNSWVSRKSSVCPSPTLENFGDITSIYQCSKKAYHIIRCLVISSAAFHKTQTYVLYSKQKGMCSQLCMEVTGDTMSPLVATQNDYAECIAQNDYTCYAERTQKNQENYWMEVFCYYIITFVPPMCLLSRKEAALLCLLSQHSKFSLKKWHFSLYGKDRTLAPPFRLVYHNKVQCHAICAKLLSQNIVLSFALILDRPQLQSHFILELPWWLTGVAVAVAEGLPAWNVAL